jgi:hypothetical protein
MTRKGQRPKRTQMAEEQVWCYEQRLRGLSLRAIAELSAGQCPTGRALSMKTVHRRIESEIGVRVQPKAAELRQMELDRLDEQEAAVRKVLETTHYKTNGGEVVRHNGRPMHDDGPVLQAQDRLLRIGERRAKLLGIDSPERIVTDATVRFEVVGIDPAALK